MKRTTHNRFDNPLVTWAAVVWKVGEMSLASAQVVAHRTARMAAAGPLPGARDRKEFTRMGTEKIDAASASAKAMAAHLTTANMTLQARAFGHLLAGSAALLSLASSRNAGQFVVRQARLVETYTGSAKTVIDYLEFTARVAGTLIKPYHSRATANARRLR